MSKKIYVCIAAWLLYLCCAPVNAQSQPDIVEIPAQSAEENPSEIISQDDCEAEAADIITDIDTVPALADTDTSLVCTTWEELEQALTFPTADYIVLGAPIYVDSPVEISAGLPLTIDMQDYGITIPQGISCLLSGPLLFQGSGQASPLFSVEGQLSTKLGVEISALGNGACALSITGSGDWQGTETKVYAEGSNSLAVKWTSDTFMSLSYSCLQAVGDGSSALELSAPACLTLCNLQSDGPCSLNDSEGVILDGCLVTPAVSVGKSIERCPVPADRLEDNGICLPLGAASPGELPSSVDYQFYDTAGVESAFGFSIPVIWDSAPQGIISAGDYQITANPQVPDWLPAELAPLDLTLHIVDPEQPFLQAAYQFGDSIAVRYFSEIKDFDSLTLYYSLDQGLTWMDASKIPESSVSAFSAMVPQLESATYLLRLEVKGGPMEGVSNILTYVPGLSDSYGGGDRDGGDQLPQEIPRPDPPSQGQETVSPDTSTLLNGSQIQDILAAGEDTVLFENQGIALEIPAEFLAGLSLDSEDSLEVDIAASAKRDFQLSMKVNDSPITSIPETEVSVSGVTGEGSSPSLIKKDSSQYIPVTYDSKTATAKAKITATGNYALSHLKPYASEEQDILDVVLLPILLLLLFFPFLAAFLLLRKKGGA